MILNSHLPIKAWLDPQTARLPGVGRVAVEDWLVQSDTYEAQMADLGWREIPNSRHENPIDSKYTAFFLSETSDGCQLERAITVDQNMYRGGVKLEDISIHFNEYLVGCSRIFPNVLSD